MLYNNFRSDPTPDSGRPSGHPTIEDVSDDEDEPEAGPPPKRLCKAPTPRHVTDFNNRLT